mmetsp:Transcript_13387/g.11464  ORF Transcript_13387/g.11464 Transcript_13387/m.11464 type:complete len:150 (-) Transcript_13387:176-625(-)
MAERRTYFSHTIGRTVFVSLDTDYVVPFNGVQKEFIGNVTSQNPDKIYFAYYHVPTYTSCIDYSSTDYEVQQVQKKEWIPIFEENKFLAVFENHVHLWKKTFPIKNGSVVPEGEGGVVYFGDGNWGAVPGECSTSKDSNATGVLEAASM